MRTRDATHEARPAFVAHWATLVLALLAFGSLAAGLVMLLLPLSGDSRNSLRAPSAVVLLLIALFQAHRAWRAWHMTPAAPQRPHNYVRPLLAGVLICYLAALLLASGPSVPCLFAAATMAWLCVLLLPLTAHAETIEQWRKILQGRGPRRAGQIVYLALVVIVAGELALRAGGWLCGSALLDTPRPFALTLVQPAGGPPLQFKLTQPDENATVQQRGRLRVAVTGDEIALSAATDPNGVLARLDAALPGVELYDLSAADAGPREYARQAILQARELQPDLLLTFVSVSDDIVGEPPLANPFDWHSLELPRLMRALLRRPKRWQCRSASWPARRQRIGRVNR